MYSYVFVKTLLIFSFIAIRNIWAGVAPTHLLVTRVGPCYDTAKTTVGVSEMVLTKKDYDSSLSGAMNISEDIEDGWTIKATMQKCHDIRNLDTCDHFKSFSVIKSGCTGEEPDDEDLYTMFFHYVTPKLSCPLQAGRYKISNFPFFTEDSDLTVAESKISTSVFGYTYRLEGFNVNDEEDRILCMDAYLQLLYVRQHDWLVDRLPGAGGADFEPGAEPEPDVEPAEDGEPDGVAGDNNEENVDEEEETE